MHAWRKLSVEWLSSTRMHGLSDAAFRLWAILVTVQDDAGEVLWDRGKVLVHVAATTDWNFEKCESLADELVSAKLITRGEGFVTLYRGEEFNGKLRPGRSNSGFFYRSEEHRKVKDDSMTVSDSQVTASDGLEERKMRGRGDIEIEREGEEKDLVANSNKPKQETVDDSLLSALTIACARDFGKVNSGLARMLKKFAELHSDMPIGWVQRAFDEAAKNSARSWNYVETVLEAWIEQGQPGRPTTKRLNRNARPSVHATRVAPGGISDPFKDFGSS